MPSSRLLTRMLPSFRIALQTLLMLLALQSDQSVSFSDDDVLNPVLAESRLFKGDRSVFLEVTISGKPLSFLVDTGSSGTWLDKKHSGLCQRKLGVRGVREAFGDSKEVETYSIDEVFVGKLRVANCEVATADLSETQKTRGSPVDGILGNNALSQAVLQLDYEDGKVRILKKYQAEDGEHAERITFFQGCPTIRLSFAGFTSPVIDTGNQYGVTLEPARLEEMRRRGLLQLQPKINYVGKRQLKERALFFVKEIEFGGSSCENVEGGGANYSTVGIDMLARFRVTLDYVNRRLYLKETTDSQRTILPGALGVAWIRDDSGIVIDDLEKGSPAFDAGLAIGDRLLRVNNKAVEARPLSEIRGLFSDAGKTIRMELKRGTNAYSKEITLRRAFPYPPVWPRVSQRTLD